MNLPFQRLRPFFLAGLIEDPLLLLRTINAGPSILVDCGHLTHLAKRVLKSVGYIFVSHAHMDHFIGIDQFTRHVLVSGKTIILFGPAGIASKLQRRLDGYDWNLVHPCYCGFEVHEIHSEHIDVFVVSGKDGFSCRFSHRLPRNSKTVFENGNVSVEAEVCDHKIPVIIYRFNETPPFAIDDSKLTLLGYHKGAWISDLKSWYYGESKRVSTLSVPHVTGTSPHQSLTIDASVLYEQIKKRTRSLSIGYISDIGNTSSNIEKVKSLMADVTLLLCECTYLRAQKQKARVSFHLCSDDVNYLIDAIRPDFLLPIHLSKTYLHRSHLLYQELEIPADCCLMELPERITPTPMLPEDIVAKQFPFS